MTKDLILIVEDNESILFNLKLLLELNDYTVLSAKNGKEAIEVLQNSIKIPNLIVSDILMPEMDGYELFKIISSNLNWNAIPFIFLSAKASPDEIRSGKLLGVDDYVTKPVDEELLLSLIENKIHKVRNIELKLESKINTDLINKIKENFISNSNLELSDIIGLYIVEYDDQHRPNILKRIKSKEIENRELDELITNLFQSSVTIFNSQLQFSPDLILVNLDLLDLKALILFDFVSDSQESSKSRPIMISLIIPKISYFERLRVKSAFQTIITEIRQDQIVDLDFFYKEIQTIMAKM